MVVTWAELGLAASQNMTVRDIINREPLGTAIGKFESLVGRHDVAFVLLKPC